MDKKLLNETMKIRIKLLMIAIMIAGLGLLSIISVSDSEKNENKNKVKSEKISVALSTSDFDSIYHNNISFYSSSNIRIRYQDGIELVPKNENYIIDISKMNVGECIHVSVPNNSSLVFESIKRSYGNADYLGEFDIYCTENGFVIVNILELEQYLRFVVPSEMPTEYAKEALKAQAVCARNFAVLHIQNPAYPEYSASLDDSVRFQVYNNSKPNEKTDEAILETASEVLKYGDEIISTYYYSTSWGHTTDLSLWGNNSADYYKALELSDKHKCIDLTTEDKFRKYLEEDSDAYESNETWYRWNYYISLQDILENLKNYLEIEFNNISNIEIVSRRAGGSVNEVKISSDDEEISLTKESDIRNIFAPHNSTITRNDKSTIYGYQKCPSSYFLLEAKCSNDKLEGYIIKGGGCGHGLGMSQNCARLLAEEGKDYMEILEYFYIGTNVTKL